MNPGGNVETSMFIPLVILDALVKIQIGQGSFRSGRFVGRHFMSPFLAICFSKDTETGSNLLLKSFNRFGLQMHIGSKSKTSKT